ncbi:hypothetical protein L345_04001, partial [Ophiophagus hannah]
MATIMADKRIAWFFIHNSSLSPYQELANIPGKISGARNEREISEKKTPQHFKEVPSQLLCKPSVAMYG